MVGLVELVAHVVLCLRCHTILAAYLPLCDYLNCSVLYHVLNLCTVILRWAILTVPGPQRHKCMVINPVVSYHYFSPGRQFLHNRRVSLPLGQFQLIIFHISAAFLQLLNLQPVIKYVAHVHSTCFLFQADATCDSERHN